jgi:hypothetical protein
MNKSISSAVSLTIKEVSQSIALFGREYAYLILGEPGIGKSAVLYNLPYILEKKPEDESSYKYDYIYLDGPTLDLGDVMLKMPEKETQELVTYFAKMIKIGNGRPKVIMIDELGKCPRLTKLIFTRLIHEKILGDVALHPDSIVFATSNNSSDGVGDVFQAHEMNRQCVVQMQKPDAETWVPWAAEQGVDASLRAWVQQNPTVLASYSDGGQEENPYIFNPARKQAFVSPRSLFKASKVVSLRGRVSDNILQASLQGLLGVAAAHSLIGFFVFDKEVVDAKVILADPENAPIPASISALYLQLQKVVDAIKTQDHITAFVTYVKRAKSQELMTVFATALHENKNLTRLAFTNNDLRNWSMKNWDYITNTSTN